MRPIRRKYGTDHIKVELEIGFDSRNKPTLCGKKGGKTIFSYSESEERAVLSIGFCGFACMDKVWKKAELIYVLSQHSIDPINAEIIDEYLELSDNFLMERT